MPNKQQVTILGAGLAGSLLAIYLARRDFKVSVYEQRADMRRHELTAGRSINLALAHRGIRALRHVGLQQRVDPLLVPMRGRMLHELDGESALQPYSQNPSECIYSIPRGELNCLLLNAAEENGVEFKFQQRLDDVDFDRCTFSFTDEADNNSYSKTMQPVIGADGAGSALRQAMIRGLNIEHDESLLDHGYKELSITPDANGQYQLDPNALHIWPRGGYMLIALPNHDGSFTVTLFLPHAGDPSFESLDTADKVHAFFHQQFKDAAALMPNLMDEFFEHPTGIMGTIRCHPWHANGSALLFGDAAHGIVPFHGQGMNCAFEDSLILEHSIERHGSNWSQVFESFTETRREDANAIADMALENYTEMRDQVRDRKFQLQKRLGWLLEKRHAGRFMPRYSMVMFHSMPYAEAKRRGAIQKHILETLTANVDELEKVDLKQADSLIDQI